mmetsp:Transcript_4919/g.10336  ORF Transcript_4919/g.10336 Transcript_4919/m.10336 type:complete len:107 (+) Transcript_4919:65-385(+)
MINVSILCTLLDCMFPILRVNINYFAASYCEDRIELVQIHHPMQAFLQKRHILMSFNPTKSIFTHPPSIQFHNNPLNPPSFFASLLPLSNFSGTITSNPKNGAQVG